MRKGRILAPTNGLPGDERPANIKRPRTTGFSMVRGHFQFRELNPLLGTIIGVPGCQGLGSSPEVSIPYRYDNSSLLSDEAYVELMEFQSLIGTIIDPRLRSFTFLCSTFQSLIGTIIVESIAFSRLDYTIYCDLSTASLLNSPENLVNLTLKYGKTPRFQGSPWSNRSKMLFVISIQMSNFNISNHYNGILIINCRLGKCFLGRNTHGDI